MSSLTVSFSVLFLASRVPLCCVVFRTLLGAMTKCPLHCTSLWEKSDSNVAQAAGATRPALVASKEGQGQYIGTSGGCTGWPLALRVLVRPWSGAVFKPAGYPHHPPPKALAEWWSRFRHWRRGPETACTGLHGVSGSQRRSWQIAIKLRMDKTSAKCIEAMWIQIRWDW